MAGPAETTVSYEQYVFAEVAAAIATPINEAKLIGAAVLIPTFTGAASEDAAIALLEAGDHFVPATAIPEFTVTESEISQSTFGSRTARTKPGVDSRDAGTLSFLCDRSIANLVALEGVSKGTNVNLAVMEANVLRPAAEAKFSVNYYPCLAGTVTFSYTLDGFKVANLPLTPQRDRAVVDGS